MLKFFQLELPKRPFLLEDVAEESVMVRRGPNSRQLDGIALDEGQVLGMSGGSLQGVSLSSGLRFTQEIPINTWVMEHDKESKRVIVQIYDADDLMIVPDNIELHLNSIIVTFKSPINGFANLMFF